MANKSVQDGRYQAAIAALIRARKNARISQDVLAREIGRRQQFVSKYESLERRLDIIEYIDIAAALGVDWRSLLDRFASR